MSPHPHSNSNPNSNPNSGPLDIAPESGRLVPRNSHDIEPAKPHEVLSRTAEFHIRKALKVLGMECDEDHPSIVKTPERFVKYLQEFFNEVNLEELMGDGFDAISNSTSIHGIVLQGNIPFRAICEHHLLPMIGYAYIGYIPNRKVVGISKIARLVKAIGTERPSLQEAITERIADVMFDQIDSKGSIVVIKARHMCMAIRGINTPDTVTTTSCVRGVLRDVLSARQEFFSLVELSK